MGPLLAALGPVLKDLASWLWRFAKAKPVLAALVFLLLVATAGWAWSERRARIAERELAQEEGRQLRTAIEHLGRAALNKEQEVALLRGERVKFLREIEGIRGELGRVAAEAAKRRTEIEGLTGRQIEREFRRRGY